MSDDYPSLFDGGTTSDEVSVHLPYDGSSGWTGSDTSKQRADDADKSGTTKWRQTQAVAYLTRRGHDGATWRELAEYLETHHGPASGALSVLHKVGQIARLKETRAGSKVYVALAFIDGRETERPGRTKKSAHTCPNCGTEVA